jgi:KAP family P-loop domain
MASQKGRDAPDGPTRPVARGGPQKKGPSKTKSKAGSTTDTGSGDAHASSQAFAGTGISDTGSPSPTLSESFPEPERNRKADRPNKIDIPGYATDRPAVSDSDPLEIAEDVQAFARLICLEQASPPLSICILGEWGSGKSTFMERLQMKVDELVPPTNNLNTQYANRPSEDSLRFVKRIVQIRFNAWHYSDANLWASLTSVFFDQLRQGGYDRQNENEYQSLITKVADRLKSAAAGVESAEATVANARQEVESREKALTAAQKELATNSFAIAGRQASSKLEEIYKADKNKLRELGKRLGREDISTDIDSFRSAAIEASTVPGKLALIFRVLAGGGWPTRLGTGAIVMITVLGIGWGYIDPRPAATLVGWFGGTFLALASISQAIRVAMPILDGAWTYAKAVQTERARLLDDVATKSEELRDAVSCLTAAKENLEDAREPLIAYGAGARADSPNTMLRYFLFEDSAVKDYEKHVGIVSRARRSFEQLNLIVTRARADKEHKVPDRIVLYIDDLDRCTHQQVYDVLQAIHLLLAFELFVVVVGVDVRWIKGALSGHFNDHSGAANEAAPATDYLEKIFQIPFWLRPLSTDSARKGQSTHAAYVRELIHGPGDAAVQEPPQSEQTREALNSVRLEDDEVNFLCSRQIGALAGKSPRAVKRLINVYRILRAHRAGETLEEFLGRGNGPAQYRLLALVLAVEVGQPNLVADGLYRALKLLPEETQLDWLWAESKRLDNSTQQINKEGLRLLREIRKASPELGYAIYYVAKQAGVTRPKVGDYLKLAQEARRYSFNSFI